MIIMIYNCILMLIFFRKVIEKLWRITFWKLTAKRRDILDLSVHVIGYNAWMQSVSLLWFYQNLIVFSLWILLAVLVMGWYVLNETNFIFLYYAGYWISFLEFEWLNLILLYFNCIIIVHIWMRPSASISAHNIASMSNISKLKLKVVFFYNILVANSQSYPL